MLIGPISYDRAIHPNFTESNDNDLTITKNEDNIVYNPPDKGVTNKTVSIRVPRYIYNQLKGISGWKTPYPIDLTEGLYIDQEGIRGYGYITKVKRNSPLAKVVDISFDVDIIEPDEHAYLTMDYANGAEAGSVILMTYPDLVNETLFTESFSQFDTVATWTPPISSNMTGSSIAATNGKLYLTGASTTDKLWGCIFTVTQDSIKPPFTMDFDMEWVRYATTYLNQFEVGLYPIKPTTSTEVSQNDHINAAIRANPTATTLIMGKRINGTPTSLTKMDILDSSTEKNPYLRFVVDAKGYLTIYADPDNSGDISSNKVWGPANPRWDISEGLYISLAFWNTKNVSETVKINAIDVYNYVKTTPSNVVCMPANAKVIEVNNNHRNTEEGTIGYYLNPSGGLLFKTNFDDFFKGSVKIFNNYNEASTYRQVFNEDNVFTRDSWYVKNGLVKLNCNENNNVVFSYWDGSGYTELNEFNIGNSVIDNVKPYYVSPDWSIIKINETYWHLFRGKQYVMVEHPYYNLYYLRKTCYDHDGTFTADPTASQVISMQSNFYCNIWDHGIGTCSAPDPAQNTRLQIIQTQPTDIYSDKIPMTDRTGIGWYDATIDPPNTWNGPVFNAREFFNIPDTRITI